MKNRKDRKRNERQENKIESFLKAIVLQLQRAIKVNWNRGNGKQREKNGKMLE